MVVVDGFFFGGFFGKFYFWLGMLVYVNLLLGIVFIFFMFVVMELMGFSVDLFNVVFGVVVMIYLFSYLFIILVVVKLWFSEFDVEWFFWVGLNWFFIFMCVVMMMFVVFGLWVNIFLGILEVLVGMFYDFFKV